MKVDMITKKYMSYLMWFLSVVVLLFQFVLQFSSIFMAEPISLSFSLSATKAGFMISSYYYIYCILQIPAGFLTDHYGPRYFLMLGLLICASGCFIFAKSTVFLYAEFGRLIMGGGLAFAFVSVAYVTGKYLPKRIFSFMIGLAESLALVGTIASEFYMGNFINDIGWRVFVMYSGVFAIIVSILIFLFVRDKSPINRNTHNLMHLNDIFYGFITMLKKPVVWGNAFYAGFMFSILTTFHALWGNPFLITAYKLNSTTALLYNMLILIGCAIGFLYFGWYSQKVKHTKYMMIFAAALNSLLFFAILSFIHMPHLLLAVFLFSIGFLSGIYVLCFSIAYNLAPKGVETTSVGFVNAIAILTAPLMQPFIGFLLDTVSDNIDAIYILLDFQLSLAIFPIVLMLSAIFACFLPHAIKK
jgi:MFS family permease